ncbi:hypothetical protein SLEP1_g15122 [Rubroshorea leprosula]|uniref:Uncharacterized protein n=1 Tax=Rubroshorea leprosula TaxID=152421 RepID=A0AAV5IQP3_9ROSI|nr:hypothetical protein SLEP1_g15122 [Rubroshorea leprosula]
MNAPSYEVHSNISLSYAVSSSNIKHDLNFCNGSKTWVSQGTQKLGSLRNLDLGSSRNPEEPIMMKSMVKGMVKMMKRMVKINGHMMMLEDEGEEPRFGFLAEPQGTHNDEELGEGDGEDDKEDGEDKRSHDDARG